MSDDYEARLRQALAKAEADDTEATARYIASDAHPHSDLYHGLKGTMMLYQGQVMGLTRALNLLTGEDQEPNVALIRDRIVDHEP